MQHLPIITLPHCLLLFVVSKMFPLQVIEGLGQHGMVGSADQSLINLHDGLRQVIGDERFM